MATNILLTPFTPKVVLDGEIGYKSSFLSGSHITGDASKSTYRNEDYMAGFYDLMDAPSTFRFVNSDGTVKTVPYHADNQVTQVLLTGYDSTKDAEYNAPYVALRFANTSGNIAQCYPTNYTAVYSDTPRSITYDYKLESWGVQHASAPTKFACLFSTLTGLGTNGDGNLYINNLGDGKSVISGVDPVTVQTDGTAVSTTFLTDILNIDWTQWHNIKLTWDYEQQRTINGEVMYSRSCCKVRLYVDDVFIPFIQGGADVESGTDSPGVWNDGSVYPNTDYLYNRMLCYRYMGFCTRYSSYWQYSGTFLMKNVRLAEYISQDTEEFKFTWHSYPTSALAPLTVESTTDSIDIIAQNRGTTAIRSSFAYTAPHSMVFDVVVCNAWGSQTTFCIPVFISENPVIKFFYQLNDGELTEITQDTVLGCERDDILYLTSAGSNSGEPETFAPSCYFPFKNDATTHTGMLLYTNGFSGSSAVSFSDDWMILNDYNVRSQADTEISRRIGTYEMFIRITDADWSHMQNDTGVDPTLTQKFWRPILGLGQCDNGYLFLCVNPQLGKYFAVCLFSYGNWVQTYFVWPAESEINHIARVDRPVFSTTAEYYTFLYINGVLVMKADTPFMKASSIKVGLLAYIENAQNSIPLTCSMRTYRSSELVSYPCGFDLKAFKDNQDHSDTYYCFNTGADYADVWQHDMAEDDYLSRVEYAKNNCRYFDPSVVYPENELPEAPKNPLAMYRKWTMTVNQNVTDLGDNEEITRTVLGGEKYTLSIDNDYFAPKTISLQLVSPPTAVITTDTLTVYKGTYIILSGAESFSDITGYLWSTGATSEEIQVLIEQNTSISLTVYNAQGSDTTTVNIICKDTPVIDKSLDLVTVETDALEIPVSPIPYQEFYVILNGQNCYITLRQLGDYLYASLRVDNHIIFSNVICNINAALNVYPSPYFTGILQFYDVKGTDKPHYSELGSRWLLKYRSGRLPGEVF